MNRAFTLLKTIIFLISFAFLSQTAFSQFTIATIDSGNTVKAGAIALSSAGVAHVIFLDKVNHDLKMGIWNGTDFDITVIDADCWDEASSIAFDNQNNIGVVYFAGATSSEMTYATFDGSAWTTVDMGIAAGAGIGGAILVYDASDVPHISYHQYDTEWNLYYGTLSGTWTTEEIDADAGNQSTIVVGSNGTIHIAYSDQIDKKMKYAKKISGGSWTTEEIDDGSAENKPSIHLNNSGNPVIGYRGGDYAKTAEWDGTSWTLSDVVKPYYSAHSTPMDLDNSGNAHFAIYASYTLKHVLWDGSSATTTDIEMISSTADFDIKVSGSGVPHIIYEDKYAFIFDNGIQGQSINPIAFSIYPNPCSQDFSLTIDMPSSEKLSVQILDVLGRTIIENNYSFDKGNQQIIIDTKDLKAGLYFVKSQTNKQQGTLKILVE